MGDGPSLPKHPRNNIAVLFRRLHNLASEASKDKLHVDGDF